jgi:hypothetical protein
MLGADPDPRIRRAWGFLGSCHPGQCQIFCVRGFREVGSVVATAAGQRALSRSLAADGVGPKARLDGLCCWSPAVFAALAAGTLGHRNRQHAAR